MLPLKEISIPQMIHVCIIIILWLILWPLMIKWVYKISKKKNTIIMRKRYIGLSLLSCSLCIIWLLCLFPLIFIQGNLDLFFEKHINEYYLSFGVAISIFYPILNFGNLYALLIRFFFCYFYHNWTDITLSPDSHWIIHIRKPSSKMLEDEKKRKENKHTNTKKRAINSPHYLRPNHNDKKNNINNNNNQNNEQSLSEEEAIHNKIIFPSKVVNSWFYINRAKYGNLHSVISKLYLYCVMAICAVIFVSIMAVYSENNEPASNWPAADNMVNFILWLLPTCVIIYFWKNTPKGGSDIFFFS